MLLLQLQLLLLSHALGNAATATKATTAGSCTGNANTATTANSAKTCTGNSATASKLATARNIKLQGAVSGNANFDGSANITINTTQANIAIVSGTIKVNYDGTVSPTDYASGQSTKAYPSGFTKDNCIILAIMSRGTTQGASIGYCEGVMNGSGSRVRGSLHRAVTLRSTDILIDYRYDFIELPGGTTSKGSWDFAYKIVLMKI